MVNFEMKKDTKLKIDDVVLIHAQNYTGEINIDGCVGLKLNSSDSFSSKRPFFRIISNGYLFFILFFIILNTNKYPYYWKKEVILIIIIVILNNRNIKLENCVVAFSVGDGGTLRGRQIYIGPNSGIRTLERNTGRLVQGDVINNGTISVTMQSALVINGNYWLLLIIN